jgi:hypothetical protein
MANKRNCATNATIAENIGVEAIYPGYYMPSVTTQNSGSDQFSPVANGWGTIHPIPGHGPTTLD